MQSPSSTNQQPTIDYVALLRGIWRRHKLMVALTFFGIATPLGAVVYYTASPVYLSQAMIAVEPSALSQIPFLREPPRSDAIASHLILLKSRSLSEAVIEALPKDTVAELLASPQHFGYYWLLVQNTIKGLLGRPPTVLSPREQAIAELRQARMEFAPSREAANVFTISATATSPRVAMDLVNSHIQVLLNRSRSVDNEEAKKAREFLEVQYQQVKDNVAKGEETIAKLQQQKGRIRTGGQTELELVRLGQLENSLAEVQASRQILSSRIEALRRSIDQKPTKDAKAQKESTTKDDNGGVAAATSAENLARLTAFKVAQEQLTKLENKLASLRERYTEAHPLVQATLEEVTQQRARVTQLARQLPATSIPKEPGALPAVLTPPSDRVDAQEQLSTLEKESNALETKEETLKLQVARLRGSIRSVSQDEVEFGNLRRSMDANRNLMAVLSDRLMAARIREQGDSSVIRIIDPASLPLQTNSSKTQKLLLMTLALAGSVALGLAFAVEFLRQPVETEADVERATRLPLLGSVGKIDASASSKHKRESKPILLPGYPVGASVTPNRPIHVELYRAIRANIETERLKSPFRSVLVTSPAPHEGKSTTILNLAHVFQEFGRRVLVVEADIRRPALSSPLALTNKPGIVDFLTGTATFEQVCRRLPSGVAVVPGQVARGDSASLLASSRFKELLHEAGTQFDLVLIDSAPILAVPDNLLLSHVVDRVILVARATMTSARDLRKAQAEVVRAGGRILGIVLNQADHRDVAYYHPQYRKYYGVSDGKRADDAARRPVAVAPGGNKKVAAGPTRASDSRQKDLT